MSLLIQKQTKLISKPDLIYKDFFKKVENFMDLMNALLFQGKALIDENSLVLCDANATTHFEFDDEVIGVGKQRDVLMKCTVNGVAILLGLENQSTVDYSMPFRVMDYDTITYQQQFNLQDEDKRKSFHPIPVLTLVLYSGDKLWHQPYSLIERMEIPEALKGWVNNWNGNIYDIKDIRVEWLKNPKVKAVIEGVQRIYQWDRDKESLNDLVLSKEEAIVVAIMTNSEELVIRLEKEESEEIKMCEVIDSYARERELQGMKQGIKQGMKQGIKQGELQGMMKEKIVLLIKLLKQKLGHVSKELVMQIEVSPEDKLDQLTIKIFDVEDEEDVLEILS